MSTPPSSSFFIPSSPFSASTTLKPSLNSTVFVTRRYSGSSSTTSIVIGFPFSFARLESFVCLTHATKYVHRYGKDRARGHFPRCLFIGYPAKRRGTLDVTKQVI